MEVPTIAGFDLVQLVDEESRQSSTPLVKGGLLDNFTRRIFQRNSDGPSLFGVLVNTISIMQDRVARARLAGDPPDVHITPYLGHVGLLEFDRAEEAIAEGVAAVARAERELGDAFRVFFRKGSIT
jgi:NTE family protein